MIAPALLASTAIILLSFVSEDAATISSALSIFGGPISWPLGFAACFAGIWLGDLGLYSLARCAGKNVLRSRWLARLADPATITRCEKTFAQNSTFTLIATRFIPGTRLPTYFAAGLFAMPARRFALITAIGALLWISVFFALTKLLGSHAVAWFTFTQTKIAAFVFTALLLLSATLIGRKILKMSILRQITVAARRWTHWEFWPAWLFYIPVALYYFWLAVRYRNLSLPTAANPGMATGGFVGESKLEILDELHAPITGDGVRTVEELLGADARAALIARTYLRRFAHRRSEILFAGEVLKLVETGNHAQGCIFRDGRRLRTNALERVIDNISRKVPGFYIGRYDIRYENEEDFKQGRNFQIVELNGASSEATNIYDARNSLISAYGTLFRQWKLVFAIGAANRARGCKPSPLRTLWREWRRYSAAAVSYPCAS